MGLNYNYVNVYFKKVHVKRAIFIFRRDLRLHDNLGLLAAQNAAEEVVLAFIFTPQQIENNPYRGDSCLQFMIESLEELADEVAQFKGKLYFFYGHPEQIVQQCVEKLNIDGVFVNRDYTPYSISRDKKIESICHQKEISFNMCDDLLLHPVEDTLKKDYKPYTVFTPYFHNASKLDVQRPQPNKNHRYYSKPIPFSEPISILHEILPNRLRQFPGGRKACLAILKNLKKFSHYATERDIPALNQTTHLSAHLKFTTCSVREIFYAIRDQLGPHAELIRALYWRDFFTSIAYHFSYVFEGAFKKQYDALDWNGDKKLFSLWCEGKTGFPIVDAGMRQLNQTGFMHNRVRMITASFLVKDLHINWQWGEKYFAQHLIDYDPAVNNGNWQWVASTGCDAQPYFRIFNPWTQAKKFDPDCVYIKEWIPELATLSAKEIHGWDQAMPEIDYPEPIVEHSSQAAKIISYFKKL